MKLKVIIHLAEEGGFLAEVTAIQGCATQGDIIEEWLNRILFYKIDEKTWESLYDNPSQTKIHRWI